MSVTPPLGLPTGPKGKWGPTLRLIRNPREAMEAWVKEFGDPFLLNALNGPVVVTGREELIRTIYGQSPDAYEPFAVATMAPLMGAGSMFVLENRIKVIKGTHVLFAYLADTADKSQSRR